MNKFILALLLLPYSLFGQNYTSYFTGNTTNISTAAGGGICLMGGATENDEAMKWFLSKANGGDVLVLRASGSDGYNNYMYTMPGVTINSVETIVCNNAAASNDTYVQNKIKQAEAIWFAGGDQWNYISYWRNSPMDSLINDAILNRNIPVGGTSAGMAIMGKYYFSAQAGSVTSDTALQNPYHPFVTIDSARFLKNNALHNVITDTHFDNPDRKGRTMTFMARAMKDHNFILKAIACDEYTSVCIETNGLAKVYGGFPTYDDNAYFIQPNCELSNMNPETCQPNTPLTWNRGGEAVKVYKVKGTNSGTNTFNLNDWKSGSGGNWENWTVSNGVRNETADNVINCIPLNSNDLYVKNTRVEIFPNPTHESLQVISEETMQEIIITDLSGRPYLHLQPRTFLTQISTNGLRSGIYVVQIRSDRNTQYLKMIKD